MADKMKRKLRSRGGETLAEVLVALLISSLALIMLAVMISSTNSMVSSSKETIKKYMSASNDLVEKNTSSGTGNVTIVTADNQKIKLTDDSADATTGITVTYYTNDQGSMPVTAYKKGS